MKLERFRKFNTRDVYPGGRLDNDMCMTVKAGNRIFMRGQTGLDRRPRFRWSHVPSRSLIAAVTSSTVASPRHHPAMRHRRR